MANDITWIFSIFAMLLLMGLLFPLLETELGVSSTSYNSSAIDSNLEINNTVEAGFQDTPSSNISGISLGFFQAFLYTFPWMWQSTVGALFGIIHIVVRLLLAILLYRLIRSGAG